VSVPHDRQLVGHSDADVLLHAITDALLGAAALGDIGQLFHNTEEANRGRDSGDMLCIAAEKVRAAGWQIGNLDCVLLMERPKLAPHREAIRQRIAELLRLNIDQVGLKAKTGEGVGTIGREEAIEAMCVALLEDGNED
jgi:2-C-methyl-D-erythritol 2,4-cyclodiphosphate synthase